MALDYVVMVIYFAAMIGVGYWGMRKAKSADDFLVAGRRLGVPMYTGTLSAVVLGGASTIGTVRLGYLYGISGMWLVFMLGAGIFLLGIAFSHLLARLRVYSVAEMMEKRYNASSRLISGVIMVGYDMMVAVTATVAIGTVFNVMFGLSQTWAIIIGGGIVILYSALGGMWSITLTDIVQFVIMTIGMFAILLPMAISKAGGWSEMWSKVPDSYSSFTNIGGDTIWLYFLLFFFGILIGQDIWQRVFTAKSVKVARIGGMTAGLYCIAYGFCGALIGTALLVVLPKLEVPDNAFAEGAKLILPAGVAGLVLAAALAAVMSTASACLMASSTILAQDVIDRFIRRSSGQRDTIWLNRVLLVVCGIGVLAISLAIKDVIGALTVAYDLLVGAVFVPVVGALFWKRATGAGALVAMLVGAAVMVGMMAWKGLYSNEAIYWALLASFVAFLVVSLVTPKPSPEKLEEWRQVTSGEALIPEDSASAEASA